MPSQLHNFQNPDGTIKVIPRQNTKKRLLYAFLAEQFVANATYTEREVNAILQRFHPDSSTLRRDLIDFKFLARHADGSAYWRRTADAVTDDRTP